MNGADRRENLLFVNYFLGKENISFFRWGQAHFLPTTPDFNICPKIPGGKGPPWDAQGRQENYCPSPAYATVHIFTEACTSLLFQASMFQVLKISKSSELKINLTNLLEDSLVSSETL